MGEVRRLLCDEMLAGLARWLRAAGHDVALLPPGTADAVVLAEVRRSGRVLVTRDRDFCAARTEGCHVVALASDRLDVQTSLLAQQLDLDWLAAPFTRCLVDGAPLEAARPKDLAEVPDAVQSRGGPFHRCPACRRVYWPGSHVRRMASRLRDFASVDDDGCADLPCLVRRISSYDRSGIEPEHE